MDIASVKGKFQIVISQHVPEQVHIGIGDLLEAGVDGKSLSPRKISSTAIWPKGWKM